VLLVLAGTAAVDTVARELARFTGLKRAWPIEAMTQMTTWQGRRYLCRAGRCQVWGVSVSNGLTEHLPGWP
jgi:hypothetical protein